MGAKAWQRGEDIVDARSCEKAQARGDKTILECSLGPVGEERRVASQKADTRYTDMRVRSRGKVQGHSSDTRHLNSHRADY